MGASRHQLAAHTVSYGETFGGRVSALVDLKYLEASVLAGQRFFFGASPDVTTLQAALATETQNLGFELARFRANARGGFGRLSLGLIPFYPGGTSYWKMGFATGLLRSNEIPWNFQLAVSVFLSFNRELDYMVLNADTYRSFTLGGPHLLQIGGFFTWGQMIRGPSLGEHILFSLGPELSYRNSLGKLSVTVPIRIWLDRAVVDGKNGYLSDFATPAFSVGWRSVF